MEQLCGSIDGVEIVFVYQDFSSIPSFYHIPSDRVKPFGTVHAVLCAETVIDEPFSVINADDFYGADAFRVMHERLQVLPKGESAMVAYRLANTVSRNGAVTRGVCGVENGFLRKVTETYRITVDDAGRIVDGESGALDGDLPVSMNFWGFTPEIFLPMRQAFEQFLKRIPTGDNKAEYALPTMVDELISQQEMRVTALKTEASWFGVTYREDRDGVSAELARLHRDGAYPSPLFTE